MVERGGGRIVVALLLIKKGGGNLFLWQNKKIEEVTNLNAASFGLSGSSPNTAAARFFISLGIGVVLVLLAMVG